MPVLSLKQQVAESIQATWHQQNWCFLSMPTGESNGNPLQYSCLEGPMDGGAWWAAVHGVAKSRTRLKRLSSSSSSRGMPAMQETLVRFLGPEDPLEKG